MIGFLKKNRFFLIIVSLTCIFVAGGVFLFSGNPVNPTSSHIVSSSLLVPQSAIATSGFSNGTYLPSSQSATVTLVEFGDYECPSCGVYSPFVKQLLAEFAGKMNFVFRNYPLNQHKNALISSYAVEAAGLQGKYWEMHEKVYATQTDWSGLNDPTNVFTGYAKNLGLNINQFSTDLNSSSVKNKVQNDTNDGNAVGITETPTFFLNGQKISLTGSYDQLKNLVQSALAAK